MVTVEHAHVAGDALDADGRAGFRDHQVEQVVPVLQSALSGARCRDPELVRDVAERTLEVGRQLSGVPAGRAAGDPVTLHEHDAAAGLAHDEEGRGDSGDARTDHHDVRRRVAIERPRRPIFCKLRDPRRPVRLVSIGR